MAFPDITEDDLNELMREEAEDAFGDDGRATLGWGGGSLGRGWEWILWRCSFYVSYLNIRATVSSGRSCITPGCVEVH